MITTLIEVDRITILKTHRSYRIEMKKIKSYITKLIFRQT